MLKWMIPALALVMAGFAEAGPEDDFADAWPDTDFSRTTVDLSEVMSGGPPKDGIPSIDNPKFRPASKIDDIGAREPVIRLEVAGEVRAYPLRVLTWHEIVNDTVAGQPVLVTYCPLCNAAIVFERRVKGEAVEFGTSGMLRHSDLVMYDRATESWWQQFTGQAIAGEMAGTYLDIVPSSVVSFADIRAEDPDMQVLVPNDPRARAYGSNPYVNYDSSEHPFLFRGKLPRNVPAMMRVVAIKRPDGEPVAISMAALAEAGRIETDGLVLDWREGMSSALDAGKIGDGRDVGSVRVRDAATGDLVAHDVTFAFAFHAFHPEAQIVTAR